jgi:Tfp pilus assembly protein PilZ
MVSDSELIWKRKDERVLLELLGDYRILEPYQHSVQYFNSIRNLGKGGVLVISDDPLLVGTFLQLRFYHQKNRFTVNSKVVWAAAPGVKEPSGYQIGLKFEPRMQVSLLNIDFLLKNKNR